MSSEPKFCGKCGSSLKDNIRFCTNCGREINEEEIKRTTKNEFLGKYHGRKILDHIEDIISERIGDTSRLRSIYYLIDSKKEIDDANFEYLKECSDKYNTTTKSNDAIPKQTIHTLEKKPFFTKYKIIGIAIALVFVSMIAIGASIGSSDSNNTNEKSAYETEIDKEKEIIKTVQEYKGKDGKGETLLDALTVLINVSYGKENIEDNPTTQIGWYGFRDISLRNNDGTPITGIYQVGFNVKTYKENIEFVWYYNTKTKEIFAGNEQGKSVLDMVDTFG